MKKILHFLVLLSVALLVITGCNSPQQVGLSRFFEE